VVIVPRPQPQKNDGPAVPGGYKNDIPY
jgi:hypothetical protein